MATGRQLAFQAIHYLRKTISFSDGASAVVKVGRLPAGAIVHDGAVTVTTAFNAGTNNLVNVGVTGTASGLASALALGTAGKVPFDELATSAVLYQAAEVDVIATLALTGTAATAGVAHVVVAYTVNNDG